MDGSSEPRDGASRSQATDRTTRTPGSRRVSTRTLLIAGALGALGAVALTIVAPATSALAATFPPAYALVAGAHSILPFLAARILSFRWSATLVGLFVGLLSAGSTVLGVLIVVPLLLSGLAFDTTLLLMTLRNSSRSRAYYVAAAVSGVTLFLLSVPVMSPEHLRWPVLILTLVGRLVGQLVACGISAMIASRIRRAGIGR